MSKKPSKWWAIWHLLWAKEYMVATRSKTMTWHVARAKVNFVIDNCAKIHNEAVQQLFQEKLRQQAEANVKEVTEILNRNN